MVTQVSISNQGRSSAFAAPMQQCHALLQLTDALPKKTVRENLHYQLRHIGENTWRSSLFKNGYFLAYVSSWTLWTGTIYIPFTFLPHRAKLMGFSSRDSSLLLSVIGISSIVGKVLFGVICDIPVVKPYRILLYGMSFVICGLALSLSFVASLVVQMICAAVFGLSLGKYATL